MTIAAEAQNYFNEVMVLIGDEPTLEQLYLLKAYAELDARYSPQSQENELITVYQGQTVEVGELYIAQLNKYSK